MPFDGEFEDSEEDMDSDDMCQTKVKKAKKITGSKIVMNVFDT
jgi:hypothetical protein